MKQEKPQLRYFLYARKSSESEDRQIQSIDDQIERLKHLASIEGIKTIDILTESKSAKMPGRPVFEDMLQRIENREAEGILCWQINRLSRNPIDSGKLSWLLQKGIIQSIQTIDKEYKPEDNVILFNVETGSANQFLIDLSKNVKRGMNGKAERGDYPTKPPLGYKNDRLNKKIMVDEELFPLVRSMWEMMLSGNYTPPRIIKIANEEWGFRTPRTSHGGDRPLANSTIYKMFNNIFYTGLFTWNRELKTGNHKAMITLEEYDRVQFLLGKKGKPRMAEHNHAYTGLIRCGECDCLHTATTKQKQIKSTGKIESYTYYYCTRKTRRVACSQKRTLTVKQLEEQIDSELQKCQINPKFLQWALDYLSERNELEIEDRSTIYESQQSSYNKTQNELDNLSKMFYRELISEEEFLRMRDDLRSQLAKLKSEMYSTEQRASKWLDTTKEFFDFATYSRARFNNPETKPEEKRKLFTSLGSNFVIKDRILSISKYEWVKEVENSYPALETRLKGLELDKTLDTTERNQRIDLVRSDWCAYRDSNSN